MESMPITEICPSYIETLTHRLARLSRQADNGCIEWTGALDRSGYGKIVVKAGRDGARRTTGTHRAAWLALRSIEDPTLVLDHLCRNRACINTGHLELVTSQENAVRGNPGRPRLGPNEQHACRLHGREDGYDSPRPDGYVRWTCRPCRRARTIKWRASSR